MSQINLIPVSPMISEFSTVLIFILLLGGVNPLSATEGEETAGGSKLRGIIFPFSTFSFFRVSSLKTE